MMKDTTMSETLTKLTRTGLDKAMALFTMKMAVTPSTATVIIPSQVDKHMEDISVERIR